MQSRSGVSIQQSESMASIAMGSLGKAGLCKWRIFRCTSDPNGFLSHEKLKAGLGREHGFS